MPAQGGGLTAAALGRMAPRNVEKQCLDPVDQQFGARMWMECLFFRLYPSILGIFPDLRPQVSISDFGGVEHGNTGNTTDVGRSSACAHREHRFDQWPNHQVDVRSCHGEFTKLCNMKLTWSATSAWPDSRSWASICPWCAEMPGGLAAWRPGAGSPVSSDYSLSGYGGGVITRENCHEQWPFGDIYPMSDPFVSELGQRWIFAIPYKVLPSCSLGIYPKSCCGCTMTCMVNYVQELRALKRIAVLGGGFKRFSIVYPCLK